MAAPSTLEHQTLWGGQARQDIATGGTFDSGAWVDSVGAYRVDGGGVTALSVVTAGAYTVAPTVVMTANGFTNGRVNGAGTIALSGGGLTVGPITITNQGKAMIPTPTCTLTGGTGIGGALGTPTLQGNTLQERFAGTTGGTGSAPWLSRAAGVTGQNSRIVARLRMSATTDKLGLFVRLNTATNSVLACNFTGTTCQLWLFDNGYNGAGTGTATNLGNVGTYTQIPAGHDVDVDLYVTSTSSTASSLTVTVTNVTTSTQLGTKTISTSNANVQSIGPPGVGFTQSTGTSIISLTTYNDQGVILVSPLTMAAGSTQTLSITGSGTTWLSDPVPALQLSGVPFTNTTGLTIIDDTHATYGLTLGGTAGTLTVTAQNGTFINLTVTGITPPTITTGTVTETGFNTNFSGGATGGVAPYTMRAYLSRYSNQSAGVGDSTLFNTQPGLGEGVAPSSAPCTTALPGGNFVVCTFTDANGVVATTFQTQCVVPTVYTGPTAGFLGDSIVQGSSETGSIFNDRLVFLQVTSGGTGYSTSGISVSISGGTFTKQAVAGTPVIVGGVIKYIPLTEQGVYTDPLNAPTVTVTGGGGSGASVLGIVGGGEVTVLEWGLRSIYGLSTFRLRNGAQAGSQTANWTPHGTVYTTPSGTATNTYYMLENAIAQFGPPSECPWVFVRLGANDCNNSFQLAKQYYKERLNFIIAELLRQNYKVLIDRPMWRNILASVTANQNSLLLLSQYNDAIDELVAAYAVSNPNQVLKTKTDNYLTFMEHPGLLYDGLHPGVSGYGIAGAGIIRQIASLLGFETGISSPFESLVFGGDA